MTEFKLEPRIINGEEVYIKVYPNPRKKDDKIDVEKWDADERRIIKENKDKWAEYTKREQ